MPCTRSVARAVAVNRYEIAGRMGLVATLREHCYEMQRMRMVDRHGRDQAVIELAPIREVLGNRFISLARSDLAVALFGACECVQANFGVEVTAIPQDRAGVLATLSDGRRERFDLVIGADGASSSANVFQFLL